MIIRDAVPADAATVVIAAPHNDLLPPELDQLRAYVERGGRVLILVEPHGAPTLTERAQRRAARRWYRQPALMAGIVILVSIPAVAIPKYADVQRRDAAADVPDFVGVGIMSDGDQTQSESSADYGTFAVVRR